MVEVILLHIPLPSQSRLSQCFKASSLEPQTPHFVFKHIMSSRQADPDQGMTLLEFLCQDTHDFSDVINFRAKADDSESSPESQSLLTAPAHQHRPGGKTSKWFDMTFRGAKLQPIAVDLRARVAEFEYDTRDYPLIRKSQEGKVGGQDVTLEYPRNESDVV